VTSCPDGRRPAARATYLVAALLTALSLAGCGILPGVAAPQAPPAPSRAFTFAPAAALPAGDTLNDLVGLPDLDGLLDPAPDPEVLEPLLGQALALREGTMSAAVRDGLTGELLYDQDADRPVAPASAVKVLTALAALEVLGPDHRYTTEAVALPSGTDRTALVLDAGGDVMLGTGANAKEANGRAGLATLARQAAQALRDRDATGEVVVRLDDSGYAGPTVSPEWSADIVTSGNASEVQPLATYGGRARAGRDTNRLQDPALYAAEVFRKHLAAQVEDLGVDVTVADDVARAALKGRGTPLASVESAPLADQMAYMLQTSDNQVAEATGRNLALATGAPASFDGATGAIETTLADLGMDTAGLDLVDASGLSGEDRITTAQLSEALHVASRHPDLRVAVTGLPVAGEEGTLQDRMVGTAGEGVVAAKTGTLSSVASLTGTVQTKDGRPLLFSFVANDQPGVLANARFALDRAAVGLAGCGCR
jgi:serine-type D-Ala-D-Ala carboxypeptidase/endopeptidase (penicillin-binding protein 4)